MTLSRTGTWPGSWRWAVLIAVLVTIAVNAAAVLLPLNGLTTKELADRYQVYFVPAGYVFSIWSVIYLLMLAYGLWQLSAGRSDAPRVRAIAPWFCLSGLANCAWIFLWHYEQVATSVIAMLILLTSLIVIYRRLDIGRADVGASERWAVHALFSIYLGWITVATIANVSTALVALRWDGWGIQPEIWTAIMLGVAVALASVMTKARRDVLYLAVLIWAFVGIAVKFPAVPIVTPAASLATAATTLLVVFSLWRRDPNRR